MPIKLNGATNGSVELDVPAAVGSDLQLTLPATAGEVVVKDGTGRVGIGESSPDQLLHLKSTGSPTLRVEDADNSTYFDIANSDGDIILKADEGNTFANSAIRLMVDSSEKLRVQSGGGVSFNGDTAAANALDDYEEGTVTNWRLAKTGITTGSNDSTTEIQYTKIGNCVYISGYLYTRDTGSGAATVTIVNTSDNTTQATLPFVPNHNGALPVLHTRSIGGADTTFNLSVGFVANSAGVYLYTNSSTGDYSIDTNNVSSNSQTHLVMTFSGHYFTDS